ncbi:MAG: GNAT family N-acetyltransferase [Anaerobacillus sp.]
MSVTLRFLKEEDIPLIQQYVSSQEISSTTNVPDPYPENGAREWFTTVSKEQQAGNHYAFAIVADDKFAGSISVRRERDRIGAIDYWIAPAFWNRGIATKAAEEAISFGQMELGFVAFETCCLVENRGSTRVLEKLGFEVVEDFVLEPGEKHQGKLARFYRLR